MRRLVRFVCLFSVFALLFCCNFAPTASYNDAEYDTYVNMGENAVKNNYAIPTLFRQNGVYNYADRYPLVVQNGIEYVSLSMFILYSHIDVNYSNTSDDFFIVNHRNDHYISFNVAEGIASTYDGDLLKIVPKLFNQTTYVPARTVAVVLGLSCETYNDRENGVYAFRIYDGSPQKTLRELVKPYVDEYFAQIAEPPKEEIKPDPPAVKPEPETPDNPPELVVPETPKDPLEELAERRVGLCFRGMSYEKMPEILSVIKGYGIKAMFAAEYDEILKNPSTVRSLFVSGHTLALSANEVFGETVQEYAQNFVNELDKANSALYAVMKRKTRLCVLPQNIPEEYKNSETLYETVRNGGYLLFVPNTETGDSPTYTASAYAVSGKVKNMITGGFDKNTAAHITAELWCSDKTQYYTADIALLVNKYRQFSFFAVNDLFVYNS